MNITLYKPKRLQFKLPVCMCFVYACVGVSCIVKEKTVGKRKREVRRVIARGGGRGIIDKLKAEGGVWEG